MRKYNVSIKMTEEASKYKVKCKHCGHVLIFPNSSKKNKILCNWCGHYIYKNDKEEFKDKFLKTRKINDEE